MPDVSRWQMTDRQHVWHDPSYPPNRVITQDPARFPKLGKSARRVFWVVLDVAFALGLCAFVTIFGSELIAGVSEAFTGFDIKDWAIDTKNAQVLMDQESGERILVFRIVHTGLDDTTRVTNPFYAVEADSAWRLTGIGGGDVIEDVY